MLTRMDLYGMLFMLVLVVSIIVLSIMTPQIVKGISDEVTRLCVQLPIMFMLIFLVIVILYGVLFALKKSSPGLLDQIYYYVSMPAVTFLITLGVGLLSIFFIPNEIVKRIGIASLAVVACWLISFPNFIRRRMGIMVHE